MKPVVPQPDADAKLKHALEQLEQNKAAVAEAINESRAERSRDLISHRSGAMHC